MARTQTQVPACPAGLLAHAPQTGRVESNDHHSTFRHQHTLDLAQGQVRIARQFQRMRQHHEVQALTVERQGIKVATQ